SAYRRDMHLAALRSSQGALAMQTQLGRVEYAAQGRGPAVLVVHGTSGGFDQGLDIAGALAGAGFRVVAPSRFGYLGSEAVVVADPERQAEAYAELLEALDATPAAVIGVSAGSPSATAFALRFPWLCQCLVLIVPAFPGTGGALRTTPGRVEQMLIGMLLRSNFVFWLMGRLFPSISASTILATERACLAAASTEERARADRILRHMLPVTRRRAGIQLDIEWFSRGTAPPFDELNVPLLAISCEDDRLGTAKTAREAVRAAPSGRSILYPRGGHILLGHHGEALSEVIAFITESSKH
ncbi:MAG TPA: alpha/beta fold hydrolase, partial [Aestuariivirgaceae bacterium]|nr:alpha/beta fold hydrolase [Aestuariivirgaceae bacterium]